MERPVAERGRCQGDQCGRGALGHQAGQRLRPACRFFGAILNRCYQIPCAKHPVRASSTLLRNTGQRKDRWSSAGIPDPPVSEVTRLTGERPRATFCTGASLFLAGYRPGDRTGPPITIGNRVSVLVLVVGIRPGTVVLSKRAHLALSCAPRRCAATITARRRHRKGTRHE